VKSTFGDEMSRRAFIGSVGLGVTGAALAGCSQTAATPSERIPAPPSIAAWEQQWREWVTGAQREEQLSLVFVTAPNFQPALDAFAIAFPGVKVTAQNFSSSSFVIPRAIEEQKAGIYSWDVAVSTFPSMMTTLKPAGGFEPIRTAIIRPDITDDKAWDEGFENGFRDNEKKWVYIFNEYSSSGFAVNTELVKEGEIKSVRDLLDPKWRGRMLLLDVRAGSFAWFLAIRRHLGVNALRQLIVDQQPVWTRDQRQLAEALVRGTYPVVLLPSKTYLEEFLIQGLGKNVRLLDLPESRVTVGGAGGVWLMNKAPHPNAAKVFINWLLTKEGQLAWNTAKTGNSRRLDVPAIDPEYNKVPGGTYFNTNREDMLAEVEEVRALVLEMIK